MPPAPMYTYRASVVRIIDGDTVVLSCDLGMFVYHQTTVRLLGINAPEVVGTQKPAGLAAKAYLESRAPAGTPLIIQTQLDEGDKYGRLLATLYLLDGTNLNEDMIASGHAAAYDGTGPRPVPPAA